MVSPSRSTAPRRRRDDAGKFFVGFLILLGLTASVFLIFSENVQYVRIGLVAALWAAVIGALAATRYRKDAAVDKAKVRDLQTVYELQLEREINARREYEMGVEARVRAEVGADSSEIAALRAELTRCARICRFSSTARCPTSGRAAGRRGADRRVARRWLQCLRRARPRFRR